MIILHRPLGEDYYHHGVIVGSSHLTIWEWFGRRAGERYGSPTIWSFSQVRQDAARSPGGGTDWV